MVARFYFHRRVLSIGSRDGGNERGEADEVLNRRLGLPPRRLQIAMRNPVPIAFAMGKDLLPKGRIERCCRCAGGLFEQLLRAVLETFGHTSTLR